MDHNNMVEVEDGGLLDQGNIIGSEGGTTSGIGFLLDWDTRDNIFYPTSGSFHQFSATLFGNSLAGDFPYHKVTFDFRTYRPFSGSHVLALQGYLNIITDEPPFNTMSLLGGDNIMRGYYSGRYRDNNLLALQAEYRSPTWKRAGFVVFGGVGDVSPEIGRFRLDDLKYSVGFGLRYMINPEEKVNLRLDFGFGQDSFGLYMKVFEAF
jgi:outer membrane protein assembly factor BamA